MQANVYFDPDKDLNNTNILNNIVKNIINNKNIQIHLLI